MSSAPMKSIPEEIKAWPDPPNIKAFPDTRDGDEGFRVAQLVLRDAQIATLVRALRDAQQVIEDGVTRADAQRYDALLNEFKEVK